MKKRIWISVFAVAIFIITAGFKNNYFEIAKQLEIFTTLYKELNMNYVDEVTPAKLMDQAIKGMLADLDPYTVYWNEQQVEDARISKTGVYSGIGAEIKRLQDGILIVEPFKDFPADLAGLKAGDKIIQIDQTVLKGFANDAAELLKGAPNTSMEITYERQGKTQSATIRRTSVELHAVPFYEMIGKDIGYIVISQFNAKTTSQTKEALLDLKKRGAEKLILDLRGNPGGLLSEAINIVNLFIPKGEIITTTKSHIQKYNAVYKTQQEPVDTEIPLAILINGRSASASEIVSGALQDLDRAVILGARSFGKGLVQRPKELTYGTQLKVTISRYYTPSGRGIQALDYWNKDEKGEPVRKEATEYNAFKTRAGRTVYDGGGILPDIEIESANYSPITVALLKDNAIFDFATDYYYANNIKKIEDFKFTNSNYKQFKDFLKTKNFSYQTQTEKKLEEMSQMAKEEELGPILEKPYKDMLQAIETSKLAEIDNKRPEIENLIKDEILKRYFYRHGLYQYHLYNNAEILEATRLLNNLDQYQQILKK